MNLKDALGLTGKGAGRDEMLLAETRRSWAEIVRVKGWKGRIQGDGAQGNQASGAGGSLRVFTSAACELSPGSPRESHSACS